MAVVGARRIAPAAAAGEGRDEDLRRSEPREIQATPRRVRVAWEAGGGVHGRAVRWPVIDHHPELRRLCVDDLTQRLFFERLETDLPAQLPNVESFTFSLRTELKDERLARVFAVFPKAHELVLKVMGVQSKINHPTPRFRV
jgi:hypothetical protein